MSVAMQPVAGGALGTLIPQINTGALIVGLLSGLVTGLLTAGLIAVVTQGYRRFRPPHRIGYEVLSDKPIGQGRTAAARRGPLRWLPRTPSAAAAPAAPGGTMWVPAIRDEQGRVTTVENASQVVIEIRHIGREAISTGDFHGNDPVTVRFPGRKVLDFQVAWTRLRDPALGNGQAPKPGGDGCFTLPPWPMNPHESFTLEALLTDPRPNENGGPKRPTVTVSGFISDGGFEPYHRRLRRWLAAATAMVVALLVGVVVALAVSGSPLLPRPVCVPGSVSFKGSTAFAPIVNEVAALYEQSCPNARITVRAIGSARGLAELKNQKSGPPIVAMYDGQPSWRSLFPGYRPQPVGVVIFAVVGNWHLPARLFTAGMSPEQIAWSFAHPLQPQPSYVPRFVPVGRAGFSGTRQAFVRYALGGTDNAEQGAGLCPAQDRTSACLEDTTMDLLTYVNSKWDSIGYAEADALFFYPNVRVIPINGVAPTRANALSGRYKFVATENLYTRGTPKGLAAAFINFLTSSTVTADLRRHLFIGCSDLARSAALRGRCAPG
jgi:ABC-type phosphate transport system substrate-binding protein